MYVFFVVCTLICTYSRLLIICKQINCDTCIRYTSSLGIFSYLFIYGLYNDAVSSSDCISSNDRMFNE
jgi:hypothetical protein